MTPSLQTILLATDGSAASEPASSRAIDLATQIEARLLVVGVVNTPSRHPSEVSPDRRGVPEVKESLATKAQSIVQRAKAAGADAQFLVWEGDPGEAICAAAEAEEADLIVVGSHGRGPVGRFLIGSVSDFVVRHARCPVMVVRGKQDQARPG